MKHLYIIILLCSFSATAQVSRDYAVELMADANVLPPRISLSWRPHASVDSFRIFRKAKTAASWGTGIGTVAGTDSIYNDNTVIIDSSYEYKVVAMTGFSVVATGFSYAAVHAPAIHNRGSLLLLVDTTFTDSCAAGIYRMMEDLRGDGWQVFRHDFGRSEIDTTIKNYIKALYATQPDLTAVLILGHIAVPYSGNQNPDGHPDHVGSWPCDGFYADMDGTWTDVSVYDTTSPYPGQKNKPGDGKWDQTYFPSSLELEISRVDFYDMPAFAKTEVQLMNSYLDRDHQFKMDSLFIQRRALISDNFGAFGGEAFGANGWRSFPGIVSRDSVFELSWFPTLNTDTYLWIYGCGGGSFQSAGGIGTTTDFVTNNTNAIFGMLFGSYFGDWNVQNNFLRAPLCSDVPALTNCWAGRPNWYFHHMAIGENIGYSNRLSMNNNSLYPLISFAAGETHMGLMGDLSLRTDYIQPASSLQATAGAGPSIHWTPSADASVTGYYVYRSDSMFGMYSLISSLLTDTTFTDMTGVPVTAAYWYMVRPLKLQQTPSGGYYNLGLGVVDSASYFNLGMDQLAAALHLKVYPVPANDQLTVSFVPLEKGTSTITLSGLKGEQILQKSKSGSGAVQFNLDVSSLAPGVYFLEIRVGNSVVKRKWVKG